MKNIVWAVIMVPVSLLFTGLGIYAWRREKPMWFWSGSTVEEDEISDIPAYNRANGIMWLVFSALLWVSTICGFLYMRAGGIILIASVIVFGPALPVIYTKIYDRYRK